MFENKLLNDMIESLKVELADASKVQKKLDARVKENDDMKI